MSLSTRHRLPWLVAVLWIAITSKVAFPRDTLPSLGRALVSGELRDGWTEGQLLHWFVAMMACMYAVDRLYCTWQRWRVGVDPMKVHWSRLRNRDGAFFCANCLSIFLLPPPDFDEDKKVSCGDCGYAVASYREMKPYLHPAGALHELATRVRQRFFG